MVNDCHSIKDEGQSPVCTTLAIAPPKNWGLCFDTHMWASCSIPNLSGANWNNMPTTVLKTIEHDSEP